MRNEKIGLRLILILLWCLLAASASAGPLHIVASTNDLAAVAREIAGPEVRIDVICRPDQNPHSFEILPRQVGLVQQADVYLKVGVALDPWSDQLIRAAENPHLTVVDCSRGIEILHDAPSASEAGADAHTHPAGNPHYWLGPSNLPRMAENIRDGLMRADSSGAERFSRSCTLFITRADSALARWREVLAPCKGTGIVSGHPEWDYFARDFGLRIAGVISYVPDGEPTPSHLAELESMIRSGGARVFFQEPLASDRIPQVLMRDTGIQLMLAPPSVGAIPQSTDVWSQFDYLARELSLHCGPSR